MASDPTSPQVGDRFWNAAGTRSILVTAVGTQNILGIENGQPTEISLALGIVAGLLPADPPVLENDLILYEFHLQTGTDGERGLWTNANSPANTGRTVIMHPDQTWSVG
jgi:hypothetical protein